MNYPVLIQNRHSVRAFSDKSVFFGGLGKMKNYYHQNVRRLMPELETELCIFGTDAREALEGAAGYHQFLIGAPQYLVLLSEKHELAHLNAGYMMEDLILKLQDLELDSCWVTFASSQDVKGALGIVSDLEVAAIAAFGYGKKTTRRLRLNIRSMSNVDVVAKHRYMEPKRSVYDMAFWNTWGNTQGLDRYIGFFDEMLWEALYAASLAPSYLNRQAYGFLLREGSVTLVSRPDSYNTEIDRDLSLGAVLLHFSAVAEAWSGKCNWNLHPAPEPGLPQGNRPVASCSL